MNYNSQKDMIESHYFSSPDKAIPIITELLQTENYKILARYYDLSKSEIKLTDLESGNFFILKERPEIAHPGGFWQYKHPFAPGFKFSTVQSTSKEDVYLVEVALTIDQGPDSPQQTGLSYFYMIKSDKGWKILPDKVD